VRFRAQGTGGGGWFTPLREGRRLVHTVEREEKTGEKGLVSSNERELT